jgi:hypothetical protein
MNTKIQYTILFLTLFTQDLRADIFGGDIPILAQIAISTAKELKATLELLDVAEKTQKNITDANRQISTHMETMDRIERLSNRADKLSKMKVRNHTELNEQLRKIRYSISESKRLEKRFEKNYGSTFEAKEKINDSIEFPEIDKKTLDRRLSVTETTNTPAGHSQNTALNTALTNQILYENSQNQNYMMKEQLEFFNEQRERNYELDRKSKSERQFLGVRR